MPSDSRLSTTDELNFLSQRVDQLERRNTELSSELSRLHERIQEAEGYRFLFENMEEGFCIIQFIDGPLGPLSDYVHLMANPAYCRHAGLPDVVGRTLREVIPDEAEVWLDYFGTVERTCISSTSCWPPSAAWALRQSVLSLLTIIRLR